jgi:class 3 adenylate cyclase
MDVATRHAAVLFADIAGSTRLYETAGDAAAMSIIGRCLDVMGSACRERDGRIVKTIGDEVMAVFPTAANAAYATMEMHKRIADLASEVGVPISIHVGLHSGPVLEDQSDVFGDTVNVAARLCAIAKGGQTLIAAGALEELPTPLKIRTRSQDVQAVKGKRAELELFELLWQESEDDVTQLAPRRAGRRARLVLRCGDKELDVSEGAVLTFGRDEQNDFVIGDRMASRLHARIEKRRDKYVLIDHSTNGTFCTVQGEREVELRREELLLRGRGRIVFGHPAIEDPAGEVVEFETGAGDEQVRA